MIAFQESPGLDKATIPQGWTTSDSLLNRSLVERKVRSLISERRMRSSYFGDSLFADPAWDILLLLTCATARDHRLSVSSVCSCAGVPHTTALRWITRLTEEGHLVRREDPTDRRRTYIELSAETYAAMQAYCLKAAPASSPLAA